MTRTLTHPGPSNPVRVTALPCQAYPVELRLRAGQPLDAAVAQAFAAKGFEAGYLRLSDAAMIQLNFVRPAPAPGHGPVAWYSATTHLAPAHLIHAGLHLGRRQGAPFLHGHGFWRDEAGGVHAGHLIGPDCRFVSDMVARGWGLTGARLEVAADAETGFALFEPRAMTPRAGGTAALLCRLRPNLEPLGALANAARRHGFEMARIEGLGSLVGAAFEAEPGLDDHAAEMLVLDGRIDPAGAHIEAIAVGMSGGAPRGWLRGGVNRVCVTCEMLVLKEGVSSTDV